MTLQDFFLSILFVFSFSRILTGDDEQLQKVNSFRVSGLYIQSKVNHTIFKMGEDISVDLCFHYLLGESRSFRCNRAGFPEFSVVLAKEDSGKGWRFFSDILGDQQLSTPFPFEQPVVKEAHKGGQEMPVFLLKEFTEKEELIFQYSVSERFSTVLTPGKYFIGVKLAHPKGSILPQRLLRTFTTFEFEIIKKKNIKNRDVN